MPEKRNIKKELESLRLKAQARGITEEDVENEIKAHRAGKKKQKWLSINRFRENIMNPYLRNERGDE